MWCKWCLERANISHVIRVHVHGHTQENCDTNGTRSALRWTWHWGPADACGCYASIIISITVFDMFKVALRRTHAYDSDWSLFNSACLCRCRCNSMLQCAEGKKTQTHTFIIPFSHQTPACAHFLNQIRWYASAVWEKNDCLSEMMML